MATHHLDGYKSNAGVFRWSVRPVPLGSLRKDGREGASVFDTVSMIGLIWLAACGVVVLLGGVWMVAYRVGFSEGRLTIPLRMITALTEHEVGCRSTDPEQMARELVHHLGFQEVEARRLVASAGQLPRARRTAGLRSAP